MTKILLRLLLPSILLTAMFVLLLRKSEVKPQVDSLAPEHSSKKNAEALKSPNFSEPIVRKAANTSHPKEATDEDANSKIQRALRHRKKNTEAVKLNQAISIGQVQASRLLMNNPWQLIQGWKVLEAKEEETTGTKIRVDSFQIVEDAGYRFNPQVFSRPTVVYNSRKAKFGILTGTIKIKTSDRAQLEQDLGFWNASIVDSSEQIQLYFVTGLSPSFDLEALLLDVSALPYVESAKLEIIEKSYEKH